MTTIRSLFEDIIGKQNMENIIRKLEECYGKEVTLNFMSNSVNLLEDNKFYCTKIGEGGHGEVYKCDLQCDPEINIVIKKIMKYNCDDYPVKNELNILRKFNHPQIINYYATYSDGEHCYIIMPLLKGKQLFDLYGQEGLPEDQVKSIIKQLLLILQIVHSQNVIHRDIKPENIIIDNEGKITLIDFGQAYDIDAYDGNLPNYPAGTLDYITPEMFKGQEYSFDADVWETGVLTYELLTGAPPFENQDTSLTKHSIKYIDYEFPKNISEDALQFIKRILKYRNIRPSVDELLSDPWLVNVSV